MRAIADRRYFLLVMGVLIALAWVALWIWGQSPYGRFLYHDELRESDFRNGLSVLIIVAGWLLMLVAMMLPTSLPLVALFHRLTRQRSNHMALVMLLIAGYLAVWTLFGITVMFADRLLHEAVEHNAWLQTNVWVVSAGILGLAGLYQFSALKYTCLDQCRSPLSFITEHWRGRREAAQAFQLGAHHGLFCVGCCWPLMLLMFAIGVGNLGWMLVLGIFMALEKNLPGGRRLSAPVGVVLLCGGLALTAKAMLTAS